MKQELDCWILLTLAIIITKTGKLWGGFYLRCQVRGSTQIKKRLETFLICWSDLEAALWECSTVIF